MSKKPRRPRASNTSQTRVGRAECSTADSAVVQLLTIAPQLLRVEFWKRIDRTDGVRVDIPALGIEGGALMLAGEAGHDAALLLFPSAKDVMLYQAAAVITEHFPDGAEDMGSAFLAMRLQRIGEVTEEARREAEAHGVAIDSESWTVILEPCDLEGWEQPVEERHLQVASACLSALVRVLEERGGEDAPKPFVARAVTEAGLEVTLTQPNAELTRLTAGLLELGRAVEAQTSAARVGRNDACPCGSGKKYKKCCQSKDASALARNVGKSVASLEAQSPATLRGHDIEARLIPQLEAFAARQWHGLHCATDAWFADAESSRQHSNGLGEPGRCFAGAARGHRGSAAHASLTRASRRGLRDAQIVA
jgi:hypothetical protein